MVPLRNISADFKIPVLYLTYDTETSDTGLMTRLEAFYDMLAMRH
jgi:benzoyl-CoA reductase/2-hydroxyglutaryl-CoA dehydratase subunit BcrC/BadD/HgdB